MPKKAEKDEVKQYLHDEQKRLNNPPVGLVTAETDRLNGKITYEFDPGSEHPFTSKNMPDMLGQSTNLSSIICRPWREYHAILPLYFFSKSYTPI